VNKKCPRCNRTKSLHLFGKHSSAKDGYRCWCKICSRKASKASYSTEYARARHLRYKREFVSAYGGKCYCCGEAEITFLTLDHINGGGHKERVKEGTGTQIYLRVRREGYPKDKYRLACMNCNIAVTYGRTCPHKAKGR